GALYKVMEFTGPVIRRLSMADRLTMCNMAVEAGAKSGIIEPDAETIEYVEARAERPYEIIHGERNARYTKVIEYNCSKIEPQVAFPPLPSNTRPISRVGEIYIDQAVIGSCTNGRIEDIRISAQVLKGRRVHPRVRLIIIPATQKVYREALREGLLEIFIDAGAVVSPPTCGPCLGGHMGVLAEGERAIATTNRNFAGRMGHPKSEIYLSNPAIAAASAVAGKITSPEAL
ncbi:aconitase family protein, partial [bacterium]|nr:aconitase family protein [bacterium]